jgi:molybdopterin-guanine dinucleotide biosynthesis protein A
VNPLPLLLSHVNLRFIEPHRICEPRLFEIFNRIEIDLIGGRQPSALRQFADDRKAETFRITRSACRISMRFRTNIEGFILVGGASSRMGRDKALLKLGNRTFVERISAAIAPVVNRTTLITSNERSMPSRFPVATDVFSGWGAFGGLHAALVTCKSEWALVVACDLPMVTSALFERLDSLKEGFDAVAPIQSNGFPQPLCSLYRIDPGRNCAQQLIASGERRPLALLRAVRTRWVSADELDELEGSRYFFSNINTPEEYGEIQQYLKGDERNVS